MNSFWSDSAWILGQAADDAAKDPGVPWHLFAVAAVVFFLPFLLGTLLGQALRLKDLSFKLGVVLFSIFFSLAPFAVHQLTNKDHGWMGAIRLGIDLAGGTNMVFQIDEDQAEKQGKPVDPKTLDKMVEAIGKRINPGGTEEMTVRRVGSNRFEVIIPGADQDKVREKKKQITELGTLEFSILANERDHAVIIKQARKLPDTADRLLQGGKEIATWVPTDPKQDKLDTSGQVADRVVTRRIAGQEVRQTQFLVLRDPPDKAVSGEHVVRTGSTFDQESGGQAVSFTLDTAGSVRFARLTTDNQPSPDGFERRLAILLNGLIQSAPSLKTRITGGNVQITGRFTPKEVDELIAVLDAGALEIPLIKEPVSEFTISPLLGVDVREKGVTAILVSAAAVFLFMAVYYRAAGLIADLCLLLNLILVVGGMALISATFTLPGLAGLVLTIGMAVDSNVLIYERMREELERGATLRMAIENGFSKAFSAIFDGNVTTLITAVILYMIGTDQIKGFAVSLFIGLVMSLFSVLYFGHLCFTIAERKRWITKLNMMQFVGETKIDFLSYSRIAFAASAVVILAGMASLYARGKNNLDIDFTGGTMVTMEFTERQETDDVQRKLDAAFESPVSLEQLSLATDEPAASGRRYRIRTVLDDPKVVQDKLNQAFSETGHQLRKVALDYEPPADVPEKLAEGVAKKVDPALFAGGQMVRMKFSGPISEATVLDSWAESLGKLTAADGGKLKYESPEALLVVAGLSDDPEATGASARYTEMLGFAMQDVAPADVETSIAALQAKRAAEPLFDEINTFDTSVGDETQWRALLAILASLVMIVIYMWFRFEKVYYGLAAVAALAHDVLVTLGSIALGAYLSGTPLGPILMLDDFKVNMGLIASLLTIVGYSLNDTIVIFDRIREVKGKNPNITYDMINLCVNQTLSRTILTSTTVLLVVLILYIFGGDGIHVFAYSMIIGTITGCYSTVYIANPVLLWLVTRPKTGPAPAAPPKAVPA